MPQSRQDKGEHSRVPGNPFVAHTAKRGRTSKAPAQTLHALLLHLPGADHVEVLRSTLRDACLTLSRS